YLAKRMGDGHEEDALRGRAPAPSAASNGSTSKASKREAAEAVTESHVPNEAAVEIAASKETDVAVAEKKSMPGKPNRFAGLDRRERAKMRTQLYEQFRSIEKKIETAESRLAEIHALQADPDAYSNGLVT